MQPRVNERSIPFDTAVWRASYLQPQQKPVESSSVHAYTCINVYFYNTHFRCTNSKPLALALQLPTQLSLD